MVEVVARLTIPGFQFFILDAWATGKSEIPPIMYKLLERYVEWSLAPLWSKGKAEVDHLRGDKPVVCARGGRGCRPQNAVGTWIGQVASHFPLEAPNLEGTKIEGWCDSRVTGFRRNCHENITRG